MLLIDRGKSYALAGKPDLATADLQKAASSISGDPYFLNELCWAKATMNLLVDSALKDCDASLAIRPDSPATLDSRGLVDMRLGNLDQAIADYDAALKKAPKQAASLFGRGIAKLRKGLKSEGDVDLAAARDADAGVDKRFAEFGIKP